MSRSLSCSIFDFLWPPFQNQLANQNEHIFRYGEIVSFRVFSNLPDFTADISYHAGRSISMPGIHIGGHMYGWDTPNELTMVHTSLGSCNKMFQTGAVAWGGSGSGSGLISIGPGSSGSISWSLTPFQFANGF